VPRYRRAAANVDRILKGEKHRMRNRRCSARSAYATAGTLYFGIWCIAHKYNVPAAFEVIWLTEALGAKLGLT
jgi:hypothetical protein